MLAPTHAPVNVHIASHAYVHIVSSLSDICGLRDASCYRDPLLVTYRRTSSETDRLTVKYSGITSFAGN